MPTDDAAVDEAVDHAPAAATDGPAADDPDGLHARIGELAAQNEALRRALRDPAEATRPTRPGRARTIVSIVMVGVAAVLVPVSITSVWLRTQLINTDRYVETVSPLARDPGVRDAAGTRITNALFAGVDVQTRIEQALPAQAAFLAVPITSGLRTVVHDVVDRILASDRFVELWDRANRSAHRQLVSVLTDSSGRKGVVQVDLSGVVGDAAKRLTDMGLPLFDNAGNRPVVFDLFQSSDVARVQSAFKLFNRLATVLAWFTVLLLVGAVVVSPNRRRGTVRAATGLVLGAGSLLVGAGAARGLYLNALPPGTSIPANETIFDTLTRSLRGGTRSVVAVGVVILVVALVLGPSGPAVRLRDVLGRLAGRAGDEAGSRRVDFGPVGAFVARNVVALRIAVALIALIVVVAGSRPGAGTIFWIAALALVALAVVEFVARAGAHQAVDRSGDRSGDHAGDHAADHADDQAGGSPATP